jgi:hypothetical protein
VSNLLITRTGDDDWQVWITLPDHDALRDAFGFVIGTGATRDAALAAAVADLEAAVDALQAPPGVIEERAL